MVAQDSALTDQYEDARIDIHSYTAGVRSMRKGWPQRGGWQGPLARVHDGRWEECAGCKLSWNYARGVL